MGYDFVASGPILMDLLCTFFPGLDRDVNNDEQNNKITQKLIRSIFCV